MRKQVSASFAAAVVVFGLSWPCAGVEEKAERILEASHDYVAGRSVAIEQTVEQTAVLVTDGKPSGVPQTTKQVSRIEIDAGKGLVRLTTKDASGKDVVVLRKGNRIAVKVGSSPWTPPTGPYAQLGDQLANPFACPLPKVGEKHSPRWTVTGAERLDGLEATVIETVGNTANAYALERMREGLVKIFPDPTTRPTIELLAYQSRHWIGKDDHRRLRVEQNSHQKMVMPGAANVVLDITAKTTALYRQYESIAIDVPEEARHILDPS